MAQFSSSVNKSPGLSNLPYAIKQMLARELAMERMRRAEAANVPPVKNNGGGTEGASVASPLATDVKLPATTATDGRRKAVPISDSFMAARLAPTAAPLMAAVEKKVWLSIQSFIYILIFSIDNALFPLNRFEGTFSVDR